MLNNVNSGELKVQIGAINNRARIIGMRTRNRTIWNHTLKLSQREQRLCQLPFKISSLKKARGLTSPCT